MKQLQRIIKLHVLFAGFFLPAAITFAITGGLYTFGIRGGYESQSLTKALPLSPDPGMEELRQTALEQMQSEFKAPELPSGEPGIRKVGTSWSFDWSGVRAEFSLEPTAKEGLYKLSYKQPNPHRFFVQLHKAKGGLPFKILAAGLAIAFLLLFASGAALAILNPRLKPLFVMSLAMGLGAFIISAYFS